MARRTDFLGDRFGDWVVTSKAKAMDGRRMWQVTNSQTDETAVVAQVDLKKLVDPDFVNTELETDVAYSAEITRKVLIGNGEYNAFDYPGTDPDDPDDYPFAVEFIEPDVVATVTGADGQTDVYLSDGTIVIGGNPFETQMSAGFDDADCCDDYTCGVCRYDDDFDELAKWSAKQDIGLDDVSLNGQHLVVPWDPQPAEDAVTLQDVEESVRNAAALKVATDFSDALVDAIADHFQSFISEWRAIAKEEIAGQLTVMVKSGE